jgi:hypothetical protein
VEEVVTVGIRKMSGELGSFIVPSDGLQDAFLTEAFFEGDHSGFFAVVESGERHPVGHVPERQGYVLFDFSDQTVASYQTAASLTFIGRYGIEDLFDKRPRDASAVARSFTHRECMGDGNGKQSVGPFDGSEREKICGYSNVHERFSTYFFEIPGWRIEQGILSPIACRATFKALDGKVMLSADERFAWESRISAAEAGWRNIEAVATRKEGD